jgi:NTP pyrophosphatase (non-canonical NTP hydrolase)
MNYIKEVLKTESCNMMGIKIRLSNKRAIRLLHASMGICTEAGELQDQLKKHIFYDKELDTVNLAEELGDLFFYSAVMLDELGLSFEEVMKNNIEKLRARYGEKFSKNKALKRDLKKERKILEKVRK